ncbi:Beta-fructofuranosidase insoluble isoenzyme 1 [Euphorbia peplus]|nr:Beta-fructofuranosidase insoluble isoenzyme 1 [Euphorbia peplus]
MISCLKITLFFFAVFFGKNAIVEVEASHYVEEKFQKYVNINNVDISKNQPYRTAFHFQPAKNWMNDPNGPMIYKGTYHFFYQYNPKGAVWGNIVWGHSTSKDLVNWVPHGTAMSPSQPCDAKGIWSGSATILPGGAPVLLFTGVDEFENQHQNLALPKNLSDPFLIEWVKSPRNPLMSPNPNNQINASSFRDPTTAWIGHDGQWRVTIGSKLDERGLAILYKSKDFYNWVKIEEPLHSAPGTGMWECPDFYPVSVNQAWDIQKPVLGKGVKYVLKLSLDETRHDYYTVGEYNIVKDKYIPDPGSVDGDSGLRYDYGKFYASKTFFDSAKNRRVLWGWVNESTTNETQILMGWSGLQGFPRTINLDKSRKQLVQWPVEEIEKLRSKAFHLPTSKVLGQGSNFRVLGITPAQADVEISFKVSDFSKAEKLDPSWTNPQLLCSKMGHSVKSGLGPFGLLVLASEGMREYTSVFFRIFKDHNNKFVVLMCSDQSRSSLAPNYDKTTYGAFLNVNPLHEELSLRTLIDHSIVESFGGEGKSCITARVYPTLAINEAAHLYAFNKGSQSVNITRLSAWSMKKAKIN